MDEQVIPADYPELRLICWHRRPEQPMSPKEAFALYERNWRYVDQNRLTPDEKSLIDGLKAKFGNGVLNG